MKRTRMSGGATGMLSRRHAVTPHDDEPIGVKSPLRIFLLEVFGTDTPDTCTARLSA